MPRQLARMPHHHTCKASTQKSLVSPEPNTSVSAPVSNTSTPNGTSFSFAGGSWSQPFATFPSPSVRLFSPAYVVPHRHLGLSIDRDFQRPRVVARLRARRRDVREDGVGLLRLLQRLALLKPLAAVAHAVEDVPHGPLPGQVVWAVALGGHQGGEDFGGG